MALWNFKSKDKFEDVDSVSIPTERTENAAVAVVVTTVRHATSVIAAGAVVSGSLSAPGDIQIEGHVIGDVRCATAIIGKDGDVKGNVTAETATIRGRVTGNVRARTIQLASTGSVEGDLSHAVLIIEEGGVFEGRSKRAADPLSELALSAPTESAPTESAPTESTAAETEIAEPASTSEDETTTSESVSDVKADVSDAKPVETKKKETATASKTPGKDLDDAPRSGVADALGERFAAAD
jgi:cytoskeletal protein CcmA (bactofilin family)